MARTRGITLAGLAILLVSACSSTPAAKLEKITAACPLLASPETSLYIDPDLIPVEEHEGGAGEGIYSCDYKRGNEPIFGLVVYEVAAGRQTPAGLLATIGRRSRSTAIDVHGIGDAAIYYKQRGGFAVLASVKQSGAKLRLVSLGVVEPFSPGKLARLATIVMDRL